MTLLSEPNFRKFWLGQAVSQVGDRVHSLALMWIVYKWTSSGAAVGAVMIATTLPAVLLGPLGGSFADRWDRRSILIFSDLARAVFVSWLAVRAHLGLLNLPELLVATGLISAAAAFFNPAAMALVPNLVRPSELTRANAMGQISASTSGVLGPLLGSALIATIGIPLAFAVNAASFLSSAALEASLRAPPQNSRPRPGVWTEIREGWKVAASQPILTRTLVPVAVINFFFSALVVLAPILAEGVYRAGSTGLGLMMSGYSLGLLGGAVAFSAFRAPSRNGPLVIAGILGMGVAMGAMGAVLRMPVTLIALAAVGFFLNMANINLNTIYQKVLDDEVRGRFFGLLTTLSISLQPIAYGLMGLVLDLFPPRAILLVSGAIIAATGLNLLTVKELRVA